MDCLLTIQPSTQVPEKMARVVTKMVPILQRTLAPEAKSSLAAAFGALQRTGGKADLRAWRDAQDVWAARAGLLLCGDLRIAKRALAKEPPHGNAPSLAVMMKDLCAFAASRSFASHRRRLGLSLLAPS